MSSLWLALHTGAVRLAKLPLCSHPAASTHVASPLPRAPCPACREEKPTSTKIKEDAQNLGSSVKQEARKVGH